MDDATANSTNAFGDDPYDPRRWFATSGPLISVEFEPKTGEWSWDSGSEFLGWAGGYESLEAALVGFTRCTGLRIVGDELV